MDHPLFAVFLWRETILALLHLPFVIRDLNLISKGLHGETPQLLYHSSVSLDHEIHSDLSFELFPNCYFKKMSRKQETNISK